jgi:hypothetical protein
MFFAVDSQAAQLRYREMLQEAAQARLARTATEAGPRVSLLTRTVNLLMPVNRRHNRPAAPAQTSHL